MLSAALNLGPVLKVLLALVTAGFFLFIVFAIIMAVVGTIYEEGGFGGLLFYAGLIVVIGLIVLAFTQGLVTIE